MCKEGRLNINESIFLQPLMNHKDSAWRGHAPFAGWLVEEFRPRTIVELGSHTGFSYLVFCQAVKALGYSAKCYAIDTWEGDIHAGLYGNDIYKELKSYSDDLYGGTSNLLKMYFDNALNNFEDGSVDLLHIDGLHTYDAVKHDYETWKPKLSTQGIILFHDTCVKGRDFGVWKLWEELKDEYPSISFTHSSGLGCLFVGNDLNTSKLDFLKDPCKVIQAQLLCSFLGKHVDEIHRLGKAAVALELLTHSSKAIEEQLRQQLGILTDKCSHLELEIKQKNDSSFKKITRHLIKSRRNF